MLVPILFLVFCFISPFIVLNLLNRNNPYVKKTKRCTQSIEAHITDTDYSGPLSDLNGLGKNTLVHYEFYINGVHYVGAGLGFVTPLNNQTITVLYDPADPSNNITKFSKQKSSGTYYIKPLLITIGIIALIIFLVILIAVASGSRFR